MPTKIHKLTTSFTQVEGQVASRLAISDPIESIEIKRLLSARITLFPPISDCFASSDSTTRTRMKVFWDPDCLLHNPPYEILSGDKIPYIESPARLQLIKKALEEHPSLFSFESASSCSQDSVTRCCEMVHGREYLNYLSHAYDNWVRTGGSTVTLPAFVDDGPLNH
jgi:hypothetical protein